MALYEYECRDCKNKFDVRQTFSEHDRHARQKCPKCGSRSVERTIEPVHVQTEKKS